MLRVSIIKATAIFKIELTYIMKHDVFFDFTYIHNLSLRKYGMVLGTDLNNFETCVSAVDHGFKLVTFVAADEKVLKPSFKGRAAVFPNPGLKTSKLSYINKQNMPSHVFNIYI